MAILNPLLLKRAICEAQLYVLTDIKTLSLVKIFLLKSLILGQETSATKLKRNYSFVNNFFSKTCPPYIKRPYFHWLKT